MLGARKFKQHSNFPFYPWSPSYADVGRLADVFGLRGSLKTLGVPQKLAVCRDRKKSTEALLRKVSNEGLHRESITFSFVIYSSVMCSLTRNDICKLYFPWISFWCQNLIFSEISSQNKQGFLDRLDQQFHCFPHADVDYAILLIVLKHGCWVVTIALPPRP